MVQIALRTLRFRAGLFAASFVAIVAAAAIMLACGGLIETGIRTAVPPERLASAEIVVAGDQRYHATGGDPDEPVVLPERVRVDTSLAEVVAAVPGVTGVETVVFDGTPRPGTVDAIAVDVGDGADVGDVRDRIDAAAPPGTVALTGDARGRAELPDAAASGVTVMALAGVLTAFAVLVSMFGVASLSALSIGQRRQDLALLRAIGATPRQMRQLVFRETLVVAVTAVAVAYVPGQLLGRVVFDQLVDRGVVADGLAYRHGWIPVVAAAAITLVAALGGCLSAGRRAARISPVQALTEVAVDSGRFGRGRLVLAVAFLAAGAVLTFSTVAVTSPPLTPATGAPAVLLLSLGLALLAPVLTKVATFLLQWPVRAVGGVTGELAMLNARGRSGRLASAVAPIILLSGLATGLLYMQSTSDEADRRRFLDDLRADAVVTAPGGIDESLIADLEQRTEIAAATAYVSSVGFIEDPTDASPFGEGWTLQGVTAESAAAMTPVEVTSGDLGALHGDTLAMESGRASRLGVEVGDTITMRMGDRVARDLRIVALFSAPESYDTMLLPAATLAAHTTERTVSRVLVAAAADTSPTELMAAVSAVAGRHPGSVVAGRDVLLHEFDDGKQTANLAVYVIVVMVAGYAGVTVVNTLVSTMASRRREFGLQRLAGSTRRQVVRMVCAEGLVVAVTGIVIGTVGAAAIVVPVSVRRLGTVVPAGSPWVYAAVVAVTITSTTVATLLPTWRVTAGRPARAALASGA